MADQENRILAANAVAALEAVAAKGRPVWEEFWKQLAKSDESEEIMMWLEDGPEDDDAGPDDDAA